MKSSPSAGQLIERHRVPLIKRRRFMRFGEENEAPRRKPRTWCPKVTPRKKPGYISKKQLLGGKCDFIDVHGNSCKHWVAKGSFACWCHREQYNEWSGRFPEMHRLYREGKIDEKGNRIKEPDED
jgi:hypothetical protein